ncbi:hypothetical protein PVL29_008605 [Vitis rotundifolia]|uniref:glutathione transferase n=1 Tax=Vitis rotundifolia TaxID=103349 RepID=A0AA39DTK4_VITRO|nr:hypothetical protein PVL29_008605 [Vitis rotundifolia]
MAVRKLYGALDCPSTIRALASLLEHDVEFELIPVDLQAGELKKMSSLSPFGELPVFQEGDLTIFGKAFYTLSSPAWLPGTKSENLDNRAVFSFRVEDDHEVHIA